MKRRAKRIRSGGTAKPERPKGGEVLSSPPFIYLEVPMPPSVNSIWRAAQKKGRVYRDAAYLEWLSTAGWVVRSQDPGHMAGSVVVIVAVERPTLAADIDNRIKALFDLLVHQGVIEDDKKITAFAPAWAPSGSGVARLLVLPVQRVLLEFIPSADGAHGGWFIKAPDLNLEGPEDGYEAVIAAQDA